MSQPITLTGKAFKQKKAGCRPRRYPLMKLVFPVSFQLDAGELSLKTLEMSHEEVRIACTASEIPLLVPRTAHHHPDERILHQATLKIDTGIQLNLKLQVLVCRRFSQKEFYIAFRIVELDAENQSTLEKQLQKALQQNTGSASFFG